MRKKGQLTFSAPNNGRAKRKRETLLKNLSFVVSRLAQLDLPVTITAIYAFGGILRDKDRLHDIDAICLYSQNADQKQKWEVFRRNFSSIDLQDRNRRPMRELWHLLKPFHEQQVPLAKAAEDEKLSKALIERGVEPHWAACFSWTVVLHNPFGFFIPDVERVLRIMLLKGIKGIQVVFVPHEQFVQGKSYFSRFNLVLAWSPEKPDIAANILGRTIEEKTEFVSRELDMFLGVMQELKHEYRELETALRQEMPGVNFEALDQRHTTIVYAKIVYAKHESYYELLRKCEIARNEMRSLREEIEVLTTMKSVLQTITRSREEPLLMNPIEEQVAWLTLEDQPKYQVRENRIREILRTLGLPEDKVKTVRQRGYKTQYELVDPLWRIQRTY